MISAINALLVVLGILLLWSFLGPRPNPGYLDVLHPAAPVLPAFDTKTARGREEEVVFRECMMQCGASDDKNEPGVLDRCVVSCQAVARRAVSQPPSQQSQQFLPTQPMFEDEMAY